MRDYAGQVLGVDETRQLTIKLAFALVRVDNIRVFDLSNFPNIYWKVYPEGEVPLIPVGHGVRIDILVTNIGTADGVLFMNVYDNDTNVLLGSSTSPIIVVGGGWGTYFELGSMPNYNWNLRVEVGH